MEILRFQQEICIETLDQDRSQSYQRVSGL